MFTSFPLKPIDRLPAQIYPCPIVEAVFEIRFTTNKPWMELPGALAARIDERYPDREELPLGKMPEDLRKQLPGSAHLPLYQFLSDQFRIHLGPQMIGLCVSPMSYPGWSAVVTELEWFLARIRRANFMEEGARLGVRYSDFFDVDIFEHIDLDLAVNGKPVNDTERQLINVFQEGAMSIRLMLANNAVLENANGPRKGSMLDVDVSFGALDFDLNGDVLERFSEAHEAIKKLFFGLITEPFLQSLNPSYT